MSGFGVIPVGEGEFLWYAVVSPARDLEHGDFINNCPFFDPYIVQFKEGEEVEGEVKLFNVIVMSQSCDLVKHETRKIEMVLVCPYKSLEDFLDEDKRHGGYYNSRCGKGNLQKGYEPVYLLLRECEIEHFHHTKIVVDFGNVFSVPIRFLEDFAGKQGSRLRLCSPYREYLSQAFARFFMRVGLPKGIEKI